MGERGSGGSDRYQGECKKRTPMCREFGGRRPPKCKGVWKLAASKTWRQIWGATPNEIQFSIMERIEKHCKATNMHRKKKTQKGIEKHGKAIERIEKKLEGDEFPGRLGRTRGSEGKKVRAPLRLH